MRSVFILMLTMLAVIWMGVLIAYPSAVGDDVVHRQIEKTWMIEGVERTALVRVPVAKPSKAKPSADRAEHPIVFAFHGHGGSVHRFARQRFEDHWPDAIVIYPQGLPSVFAPRGHYSDS